MGRVTPPRTNVTPGTYVYPSWAPQVIRILFSKSLTSLTSLEVRRNRSDHPVGGAGGQGRGSGGLRRRSDRRTGCTCEKRTRGWHVVSDPEQNGKRTGRDPLKKEVYNYIIAWIFWKVLFHPISWLGAPIDRKKGWTLEQF